MAGDERTRRRAAPIPRRATSATQGATAASRTRASAGDAPATAVEPTTSGPDTAPVTRTTVPASGFDLLSRMGHELRSPLSAILGFAQILRADEQAPLSERHAGMVRQIEASGLSLLAMVDDLVELSRMEAGRLVPDAEGVDLGRLLREVCATLAPQCAAGRVTLTKLLPEDAVTVRSDRARLRHLVTNLLAHAIRYNRRGGTVTLRLTVAQGCARISVCDTGGGLDPDTVQALFDPFARTTLDGSSLQGAGIGLLVARRLAEALGATLALEVTAGVGTETSLLLPRVAPQGQPDAPAAAARPRTAGTRR